MELNKNEIDILLELITTAIRGLDEDLNQKGLSDQGATVIVIEEMLYRLQQIIRENMI
jgi:hypothetical protein